MNGAVGKGEFRRHWRTLLSAAVGVGLGIAGLLTYTAGLFFEGLSAQTGLDRTTYGAAFLGATLAMALALPVVGGLVDRHGPRLVAAAGASALAVGFLLLAQTRSIAFYLVVMAGIGLLGGLSSPVSYSRAVAASFVRRRGLALGITQLGIGLAAALVPPLIAAVVVAQGWRAGFVALAALAACGIVPALLLGQAGGPAQAGAGVQAGALQAAEVRALRRSARYRLQMAAFVGMALAFAGLLPHFVPMLRGMGFGLGEAGALAGLIGLSVIVTRVAVGWLADLVEPALLGAVACFICAVGCLALALGGAALAPVGALAFGLAMGTEADLIGIMTARHFPVRAYGRLYAPQYAAFMVAAGVSPLWVGGLADLTGDYRWSLAVAAAGLLVPALLFLRLGRLPGGAG